MGGNAWGGTGPQPGNWGRVNGGEGEWIFNEGNELETLTIVLVLSTAPRAKIFSHNETVLQWKT